ncbi:MAG: DUF4178 domain-containing protein [Butyrivibrio sp.]|nr:DUF4178 domain-containing protein [Butyrivibrio sp.]
MNIRVGSKLQISNLEAHVIGEVTYKNTEDGNKRWTEYRLKTKHGERWLSIDDVYKEYTLSWPENGVRGRVGPEWHEVDKGHQVVVHASGDVDVESGDEADFVEFEDASEDNTLSVEIWDDGTEYSKGVYLDKSDIRVVGYEKPKVNLVSGDKFGLYMMVAFIVFGIFASLIDYIPAPVKKISKYIKSNTNYAYVTSITGNQDQKADVYEYKVTGVTTDTIAKDIIDGVEGETESVTQQDDILNHSIAIVTKKEYCLLYHPDDDTNRVYVQISPRKYNYTSDNSPYRSSDSTTHWYRSHYYNSSYAKDSTSYKRTPSAYSTYSGDTIHNIGNGYFDSYSSSVRQRSINARRSSGGGMGGGK